MCGLLLLVSAEYVATRRRFDSRKFSLQVRGLQQPLHVGMVSCERDVNSRPTAANGGAPATRDARDDGPVVRGRRVLSGTRSTGPNRINRARRYVN